MKELNGTPTSVEGVGESLEEWPVCYSRMIQMWAYADAPVRFQRLLTCQPTGGSVVVYLPPHVVKSSDMSYLNMYCEMAGLVNGDEHELPDGSKVWVGELQIGD